MDEENILGYAVKSRKVNNYKTKNYLWHIVRLIRRFLF
jgi:hypothetical protein